MEKLNLLSEVGTRTAREVPPDEGPTDQQTRNATRANADFESMIVFLLYSSITISSTTPTTFPR